MFCSACGETVESDARFCRKCGAQVQQVDVGAKVGEARGFGGLGDLVGTTKATPAGRRGDGPTVQPATGAAATHDSIAPARNADLINTAPPTELNQSSKFLGGTHHPWRRYFAKTLDVVFLGVVAYVTLIFAIGVVSSDLATSLNEAMDHQILASVVLLGLWIPVESLLLASVGTTPARALFRITVRKRDGARLKFTEAFVRSCGVAVMGMGGGIPLVALFTQYFAYQRLTRTGTTWWDNSTGSEVRLAAWGPLRAVACVVVSVMVIGGMAVLGAGGF